MFLKELFSKYKLHINVIGLVMLTSMVFIYPFDSSFRFTLGCVVLYVLLIYFRQLPVASTIIFSGVAIFIIRSGINILWGDQDLSTVLLNNLPAFLFYIVLAVLWHMFDIRGSLDNMALVILKLSMADIISNVAEIAFRPDLLDDNYEDILVEVIGVGMIRAILALYGYYSLKKYQNFVLVGERLARYSELTLMIAKLRTELFYLKKSSQNIEQVMAQSYWLYNALHTERKEEIAEQESFASQALTIARSIHEIKKDYYRVSTGIENVLKPSTVKQGMALTEIMFIIEQNTMRFLASTNRIRKLHFSCQDDLVTDKHYLIVSILDNLISNAIEACGEGGNIEVSQAILDGRVVFRVVDDGCGINEKDYDLVFEPGYSTKFSPDTGKMSTGLGLAHAKNLVEQLEGTIRITSELGCTCFTIQIPFNKLAV